jgi:Kelch motif
VKKLILLYSIILSFTQSLIVNVNAQSTDLSPNGVYVPRITTAQRDAITTPTLGQLIYNTDVNCFNVFQKNNWQNLCGFDIELTDSWKQKATAGTVGRTLACGFSIGNKGYLCGGQTSSAFVRDFWEYDSITDVWTQKADFGGTVRFGSIGISIGSLGYVGTGYDFRTFYRDFWEYNPNTNTWTQKADFGGGGRYGAVGFTINNKGYIGTGAEGSDRKKDFWEYNPSNNNWTQKTDCGGSVRSFAVGFSINDKGYVGTGDENGFTNKKDFWEYNPSSNAWTQKADFGGVERYGAIGFSLNNKGYVGLGFTNDLWEFKPEVNSWTKMRDFPLSSLYNSVSFSINNRAYVGTGFFSSTQIYKRDFYEYTPFSSNLTQQGNEFNAADQLVKLDAYGNINIPGKTVNEAYINIPNSSLQSNWVAYNPAVHAVPGYFKDKRGIVHLKGLIKNGITTYDTPIFTLPLGYRPTERLLFNVTISDAFGRIDIRPDGKVVYGSGSTNNAFLSLDGVSFRVD